MAYKDHAESCYCQKWQVTPDPVFHNFWLQLQIRKKIQDPAKVDSGTLDLTWAMTQQFSQALPLPCCGCACLVEVGVPYIQSDDIFIARNFVNTISDRFHTLVVSSSYWFQQYVYQFFLRCFRDPIQVPRISNQVPRIRQNRVTRISEIGSLQVHTGYLIFSFKKTLCLLSLFSDLVFN